MYYSEEKEEPAVSIITTIKPFKDCPALDGCHCQTNSLAKIYNYNKHPLSEDMLLGLGAGMGFIYWKMKMESNTSIFIGGRGNNKNFFNDIGKRTGVRITSISTGSSRKAEVSLLDALKQKRPVMMYGDMGFLPWFNLPEDYHFGGHTFVICGYDGTEAVLASDMDSKACGLKKGFYYPITFKQLSKARNSTYKPFPPKNTYFEFDFDHYHEPVKKDIYSSIEQTVEAMLNPPIRNLGIKGIRYAAKEIIKWPDIFNNFELRMNLFNLYVFIEIGGTGGGCFRYMYSRFLREATEITGNTKLRDIADRIHQAGELFTEIGLSFKDSEKADDLGNRISSASRIFTSIAELEEAAYSNLSEIIK